MNMLKIAVVYDTGSASYRSDCIGSEDVLVRILEQWKDLANIHVEWSGRLNDADSNTIRYCVLREAIVCVDAVTVNGME